MSEYSSSLTSSAIESASDTTVARVELPAGGFALAGLFERVPNVDVELEPAVANPTDHALLVVRATEHERGVVETSIESDLSVGAVEYLAEREGGWAYRVTWDGHARRVVRAFTDEGVTVLSLRGRRGRWTFRLLVPDRESVGRMDEALAGLGCAAEWASISTLAGEPSRASVLTDPQRETLVEAFENGYYDIPRNVSSKELAERLGISHQALSERFRRAHERLVADSVGTVTDDASSDADGSRMK